jgi:hypothetical protein
MLTCTAGRRNSLDTFITLLVVALTMSTEKSNYASQSLNLNMVVWRDIVKAIAIIG